MLPRHIHFIVPEERPHDRCMHARVCVCVVYVYVCVCVHIWMISRHILFHSSWGASWWHVYVCACTYVCMQIWMISRTHLFMHTYINGTAVHTVNNSSKASWYMRVQVRHMHVQVRHMHVQVRHMHVQVRHSLLIYACSGTNTHIHMCILFYTCIYVNMHTYGTAFPHSACICPYRHVHVHSFTLQIPPWYLLYICCPPSQPCQNETHHHSDIQAKRTLLYNLRNSI